MTSTMLVETISRVLATQRAVGGDLASASELLKDCPPATDVLMPINAELGGFPSAMEGAMRGLGVGVEIPSQSEAARSTGISPAGQLGFLSGRLNEAALACAALHAVAHRAFESTGEGNLADLAEGHALAYLTAAAAISEAVSEVVVWELEQAGDECHCRCGSCALGVCLCARHGKETVAKVREAAAVRPSEQGIAMRLPRQGSPANRAGLLPGDTIVAAGDKTVVGPLDLLRAIRDLAADADVELTVARAGSVTSNVALQRA